MANTFDVYPRNTSSGQGTVPVGAGPAAGLVPVAPIYIKVPLTAGAGTALDIQVTAPQKLRLIDAFVITTSTVTSAVVQVFSAASGGGTAATSSMAAAAAGTTRNALTAATSTFAKDAVMYVRQSGGATLSGGEVYLVCLPEV